MSTPRQSSSIRKVGIIGEGKMGSGILYFLSGFNFEIVWVCSAEADLEKLLRQFEKRIKRITEGGAGNMSHQELLLKAIITKDPRTLYNCDLIIEAIPEVLAMKQELFLLLDTFVQPGCIFTSNSSSIKPSDLVKAGSTRPFAGLHFFYPVSLKNMVEFTPGPNTSPAVRLEIESFLRAIGRSFITLDEKNSFILNKIFLEFQNEAFRIVQDDECTFSQMDRLVKKNFFPFGVFDFCDSVGLDTMANSVRNYSRDYPDRERFERFLAFLDKLVAAGKLGVKTREGFYQYPVTEAPGPDPAHASEIEEYLRQTWFETCKKFAVQSSLSPNQVIHAIEEYFGIELSPLERLLFED